MTFIASISSRMVRGPQIGAHRGGARAGDDDRGDDRTDLRDRCQRRAGAGQVPGADLDSTMLSVKTMSTV